jgi:hypothetical protein
MNNSKFEVASKIVFILMIIIIGFSIFSFISILFTEPKLYLSLAKEGFDNIFFIFDKPIKLLTAAFALLAVWLTLRRMRQTQEQIIMMSENNQFNNYYKHYEKFHEYIKNDKFFVKMKGPDPIIENNIREIYNYFYYRTYENFRPRINDVAMSIIDEFMKKLKNSSLNRSKLDINKLDEKELLDIINIIKDEIRVIVNSISDIIYMDSQIKDKLKYEKRFSEEQIKKLELYLIDFCKIQRIKLFIDAILIFDGKIPEKFPKIEENYNNCHKFIKFNFSSDIMQNYNDLFL